MVKFVRPTIREDVERLVRWMARREASRKALNLLYAALPYGEKDKFHSAFSNLFRGCDQAADKGTWSVTFAGKRVNLPFGGNETWLEWDAATAVLGHETEIKRTYDALVRSNRRPRLFFDVGANCGLHSLLFLVHDIQTVSFEPNSNCHPYFRAVSQLNRVDCDIQPLALGADERMVELSFPETETWLGTTVAEAKDRLSARGSLVQHQVPQTTLDAFCKLHGHCPDLIKIDTEGNELNVLRGGIEVLKSGRPVLIFESWRGEKRDELFALLENVGYRVCELPLPKHSRPRFLDRESFGSSPASNFAGMPNESTQ